MHPKEKEFGKRIFNSCMLLAGPIKITAEAAEVGISREPGFLSPADSGLGLNPKVFALKSLAGQWNQLVGVFAAPTPI